MRSPISTYASLGRLLGGLVRQNRRACEQRGDGKAGMLSGRPGARGLPMPGGSCPEQVAAPGHLAQGQGDAKRQAVQVGQRPLLLHQQGHDAPAGGLEELLRLLARTQTGLASAADSREGRCQAARPSRAGRRTCPTSRASASDAAAAASANTP